MDTLNEIIIDTDNELARIKRSIADHKNKKKIKWIMKPEVGNVKENY